MSTYILLFIVLQITSLQVYRVNVTFPRSVLTHKRTKSKAMAQKIKTKTKLKI